MIFFGPQINDTLAPKLNDFIKQKYRKWIRFMCRPTLRQGFRKKSTQMYVIQSWNCC